MNSITVQCSLGNSNPDYATSILNFIAFNQKIENTFGGRFKQSNFVKIGTFLGQPAIIRFFLQIWRFDSGLRLE